MQREACDPWIGRDIGDRIVVRRQIRTLAEFLVENRVEPVDLLLVAPERVAFMGGISTKMVKLAEHRAYPAHLRSEEHTSELQSLMRISSADLCLKKKITLK